MNLATVAMDDVNQRSSSLNRSKLNADTYEPRSRSYDHQREKSPRDHKGKSVLSMVLLAKECVPWAPDVIRAVPTDWARYQSLDAALWPGTSASAHTLSLFLYQPFFVYILSLVNSPWYWSMRLIFESPELLVHNELCAVWFVASYNTFHYPIFPFCYVCWDFLPFLVFFCFWWILCLLSFLSSLSVPSVAKSQLLCICF